MSDKKHIDRLFQEGFKDFEAQPSNAVWKNIELKLNEKKKKRRILPIWWRYAGAAALLLLFLGLGGLFFNSETNTPPPIVETEPSTKTNKNTTSKHNESIASENAEQHTEQNTRKNNLNQPKNTATPKKPSISVAKTNFNSNQPTKTATSPNSNIAQTGQNAAPVLLPKEKHTTQTGSNETQHPEAIAASSHKENGKANQPLTTPNKEANKSTFTNPLEQNSSEIAKNNEQNNTTPLEEALEKNKNLLEEETNKPENKWSVAPNAAPVYFNTLGEGSPIDPQFSNNHKSGEVNMSYGIFASYAINNKIKIRSGINKVNLGYNTNDIVVYQSIGLSAKSKTLKNVNLSSSSNSAYSAVSFQSLNHKTLPQDLLSSNTTINQSFGYIEVPLEIQYALSNKKLGLNLIGGFSSLFLDNNEIYSRAENGPMVLLGEANNINKVSYSANLGLGLNYQVTRTFDLNLEPMFKYQFKTFKNTSGNFTPFFIGVYTGLSIKF